MRLNYENLVKAASGLSVSESRTLLRETFRDKQMRDNFEFPRLFEQCFGMDEFRYTRSHSDRLINQVFEAAGATSTAAFLNISGQIAFSTVMEAAKNEEFIFTSLIGATPTVYQDGEKIPGITMPGDEAQEIAEGDAYPLTGLSEDYIETPKNTKRGHIMPVTREAILGDRTGLLLDRLGKVGLSIGLKQEKDAVDAVIDENRTTHRYKWRGTSYATYQTSTPWDNVTASTTLLDWTSINAAEQTLNEIVDPNTGEPILITPKHLIVTKQNAHTAKAIMTATNNRLNVGGYATSGNLVGRDSPNTLDSYQILTSRYLAFRMATDTTWYLGDVTAAVKYMQNWPLEVTQAPPNSQKEFENDIVMQFKASRKGEYVVVEPRAITKCTV